MPSDAWLATAPTWVNPDAFQQFIARQMFHNDFNLSEPCHFDHLQNANPLAQGVRQISSDRFNVAPLAQKVARPHPSLLPQEKGQKKSFVRPLAQSPGLAAGADWEVTNHANKRTKPLPDSSLSPNNPARFQPSI
jgi:hypothetical protein